MISTVLKWTGMAAIAIIIVIGPAFVYMWSDHMERVRDWQAEDIAEYRERSIDWNTVDTANHDQLLEFARDEVIGMIVLGIGGISDERNALRDAATEVMFTIRSARNQGNEPSQENVDLVVKAVADAQQRLYDAHDRFQSNWFYAMAVTL